MAKHIIFFELNEVPFKVIDDFCRRHPSSALAKHLNQFEQFETRSDDDNLSPWSTWPTVHRGVTDERHGILAFGQDLADANRTFPSIWELLRQHQISVGVGGSLHSYPPPADFQQYAFYLPDAFAEGPECHPSSLTVFQKLNLAMSRASARNVDRNIPIREALSFLLSAPSLGLTFRSVWDILGHLFTECVTRQRSNRRRTYQSVLAFDLFMRQLERTQPAFATFFTNHVASSMHRYWAAAYPEDYQALDFDQRWLETYRHEIDFAMTRFDRFLGRLIRFVQSHPDYELWIASSMGQASTKGKPIDRQLYLKQPERFMAHLGLGSQDWVRKPAMLPQVNIQIPDRDKAGLFRQALKELQILGRPIDCLERDGGFFSLSFGHVLQEERPYAQWRDQEIAYQALGLESTEIEDHSGATAYHVPTGILMVYPGKDNTQDRKMISTKSIAPLILKHFSVPVPDYMTLEKA